MTVSSVGNDLSQPTGYIFNYVKFTDRTCENRTSGSPQLVVRTSSTPNAIQKMMAMKAALMTAVASGQQVRVHWGGDYCWIDDVLQCGDDACYVPY